MQVAGLDKIDDGLWIHSDYRDLLKRAGLTRLDDFFAWDRSPNLTKPGLAAYRTRFRMELKNGKVFFMKRFDRPSLGTQVRQWREARCHCSCAGLDLKPLQTLPAQGIATPQVVAFGQQWNGPWERRSMIVTEQLPNAESLERVQPDFFHDGTNVTDLRAKRTFIVKLARWIARFHEQGYRHRDLYLAHIFYDPAGMLYLIDLTRVFKPWLTAQRYRVKDLAQLFYSTPADCITATDWMRFYRAYCGHRLTRRDKSLLLAVDRKAQRMARHDEKHDRLVPFKQSKESPCPR